MEGDIRPCGVQCGVSFAELETPASELQSIAGAWRDASRRAFLDGWISFAATSEVPLVPMDVRARDEAIAIFELDKALYELAYEIENRPDWIAIPLRGIHALVHEHRKMKPDG